MRPETVGSADTFLPGMPEIQWVVQNGVSLKVVARLPPWARKLSAQPTPLRPALITKARQYGYKRPGYL